MNEDTTLGIVNLLLDYNDNHIASDKDKNNNNKTPIFLAAENGQRVLQRL